MIPLESLNTEKSPSPSRVSCSATDQDFPSLETRRSKCHPGIISFPSEIDRFFASGHRLCTAFTAPLLLSSSHEPKTPCAPTEPSFDPLAYVISAVLISRTKLTALVRSSWLGDF